MQNLDAGSRPAYSERLAPSLWLFLGAAVVGPMAALTLMRVVPAIALVIGAVVTALAIILIVVASPRVRVDGRTLRAGRAFIDSRFLGEPVALTGDEARQARGPGLPPRGWHLIRGGIDGLVVVPNIDPDDPVTHWSISTRTPDRLAAAVDDARVLAASDVDA